MILNICFQAYSQTDLCFCVAEILQDNTGTNPNRKLPQVVFSAVLGVVQSIIPSGVLPLGPKKNNIQCKRSHVCLGADGIIEMQAQLNSSVSKRAPMRLQLSIHLDLNQVPQMQNHKTSKSIISITIERLIRSIGNYIHNCCCQPFSNFFRLRLVESQSWAFSSVFFIPENCFLIACMPPKIS